MNCLRCGQETQDITCSHCGYTLKEGDTVLSLFEADIAEINAGMQQHQAQAGFEAGQKRDAERQAQELRQQQERQRLQAWQKGLEQREAALQAALRKQEAELKDLEKRQQRQAGQERQRLQVMQKDLEEHEKKYKLFRRIGIAGIICIPLGVGLIIIFTMLSNVKPEVVPRSTPASPLTAIPADFVWIHGGTFTMGSPASEHKRQENETPHQAAVSSFYMGRYEVTQREFKAIMGKNQSEFKGADLPVEYVTWYDAIEYCNKRSKSEGLTPAYTIDKVQADPNNEGDNARKWTVLWNRNANGYRLPTEAEWEYACRAGTTTPYYSGKSVDGAGWYAENSGNTTHPGGQKQANAWGLYDMHGNVMEWCWDWYGLYTPDLQSDPSGPVSGKERVQRGGSLGDNGELRSASRDSGNPWALAAHAPSVGYTYSYGFRLVRGADP